MKIRSYGLGINQITQLIKASNVDFPTGNIKEAENQFVVRVAGNLFA